MLVVVVQMLMWRCELSMLCPQVLLINEAQTSDADVIYCLQAPGQESPVSCDHSDRHVYAQ